MVSLGIITIHPGQENAYFSEVAKRAQQYNIQVVRFTPTSIEPATEIILGQKYDIEKEDWIDSSFPLPEYLYDRCFYSNDEASKRAKPIMQWLKLNPKTTFLGYGLPNKWEIYQALKQDNDISFYLPSTHKVTTSESVLRQLGKQKHILLKPETGSMGRGILGISLTKEGINVKTHKKKHLIVKTFNMKKTFIEFIDELLQNHSFICQPFLQIQDDDNSPFDIRILLQKTTNGTWAEVGRGVRKGNKDYIISNISGGGEVINFHKWSKSLSPREIYLLNENIQTILTKLPTLLESSFKPMFEIGIDLGLAKDGTVWILDTNSKPGRKVVLATEPNKAEALYSSPLRYCKYLADQSVNVKRR
ncbi:YheC/YheD family endospore coat-associated protein [Litchfieldia alkalitelluris]|uniref:YheC/YheD family endospore coat-associated protein n=1 Tax=Litchfieldia alkalitelluris TaxID=304268 RepID=UPI000997753E|nr:YheC/YheD family protein [Litchfieldia alkalitelluris]